MRRRAGAAVAGMLLLVTGCDRTAGPAPRAVPATVTAVALPSSNVVVGDVAGTATVRVADAQGNPISGVRVAFVVSAGTGALSPTSDTTRDDGTASSMFTAGTQRGEEEITAIVGDLSPVHFGVTANPAATDTIAIGTRDLRIPSGLTSASTSAVPRDSFQNPTGVAATWIARDTSAVDVSVTITNQVRVQARRRPSQTWIVGTAAGVSDSILVTVQSSDAPCAFLAAPVTPALGQIADVNSGGGCFHAADADAEFVVVGNYNTAIANSAAIVSVTANGIVVADSTYPPASLVATDTRDATFERGLRGRESSAVGAYVDAARAWYGHRPPALRANVAVGDKVSVNVNSFDFCANPTIHRARVAAITKTAVVLADTANPDGGFTDDEYRSFGEVMDTLVNPLDTLAFGAPTDIDGNGRSVILFTRAVNELTPTGSPNGIVLGFYYLRDLLPSVSPLGNCPGSNVGEMFYMLVPDPTGTINGNQRDKAFVEHVTAGTIAHEYQHLINASRRMYVTRAPRVDEESWLNEGLSHIAEELLFYRATGLAPRSNLGASAFALGNPARDALMTYQLNNLRRYREYLKAPEDDSPLAANDDLGTRGASWAFLRFIADRTRTTDGDFWHRLVNSQLTGVPNLDAVLAGTRFTSLDLLRDWSLSVLTDDIVAEPPALQQPSWNFPSAMPAVDVAFALV
ncbi:MAG TPA: Ig-like domain-containing protein, partial [Gemmatimonadaceae bacterium]|nr:Ig-like domain-containing protein [Gemmatimonadaceae bacterium]